MGRGVRGAAAGGGAHQPPQTPPAPPVVRENATVKVSDHVWVIPDNSVPLVPNVGIIVGSAGTLVIDTGLGVRNGEAVMREVAKVSKNRDLYLITTHYHAEHVAGIAGFPPSTTFVVSRAEQQDLDEQGQQSIDLFASRNPVWAEYLKGAALRNADVTFDREHTIDLGGIHARALSLGPTHTRGDTSVFVPEDRVLFTGDIAFSKAFLAFPPTANVATWIRVLDELEPLHAATIIPSHGPTGDGSVIDAQRTVLKGVQARAAELRMQGKPVDEAVQTITAEFRAKYPDWTGPNRLTAVVRSLYDVRP
jgi:glyoxylase-like metal-dependent hydrolase (beta-lactamase superfamily II)